MLAPLAATPAHMARSARDHKGLKSQPYMSAVNGFFKDHGLEAVALGDLVAKARKGLAASHATIDDVPARVHLSASIVVQALRMAQALRVQLMESTTHDALTTSPTRDQGRLLRTCTTIIVLYLFFIKGGSGIDCLTEDLVASKTDGIRLYHRTRKGQRGVST
jgi:hypothetical protein